jgi:hypothetical protein
MMFLKIMYKRPPAYVRRNLDGQGNQLYMMESGVAVLSIVSNKSKIFLSIS